MALSVDKDPGPVLGAEWFSVEAPPPREVDFVASLHTYLKFSHGTAVLVGPTDVSVRGLSWESTPGDLAVRLPLGLASFLTQGPVSELTNQVRSLDPREGPGAQDPATFWSRWCEQALGDATAVRAYGDWTALVSLARRPGLRVADLAEGSGYSSRQLQRLFLRYTGFTPQRFLDLCRFERSWRAFQGPPERFSWTRAVSEGGYYDQSHLIRAFKRFSGLTPTAWLARMSDPSKTNFRGPFILPSY